MKYKVKIDGRKFEVELEDLFAQPIIARVDGEPIEVWLEGSNGREPAGQNRPYTIPNPQMNESQTAGPASKSPQRPSKNNRKTQGPNKSNCVHAPIPGVILSIAVQPGNEVSTGQELCILEAMKMKNIIRAPKDGRLAKVHVMNGQTVKHHDPLVEYAEEN